MSQFATSPPWRSPWPSCWPGPGPAIDDHSAELDQARELEQAQRDAQRVERRFDRAAQAICGPQSPWQLLADGVSIQCLTKRGIKTIVAQVRP